MIIQYLDGFPRNPVMQMTPNAKEQILEHYGKTFTDEEKEKLKEMAKMFEEGAGVVFIHELPSDWIERCLEGGKFTPTINGQELLTKDDVRRELGYYHKVEFRAHSGGTPSFLDKLKVGTQQPAQ
jgi:hypothetical protein